MNSLNQLLPQAAKFLGGKGKIVPESSGIVLFGEEAARQQTGASSLGHQWI